MQNRIRRRQARGGKIRTGPQAEKPRPEGGPGRQAKACQHRRRRRQAGSHRRRNTKQERWDTIQTLQLDVPRGYTAQGSCRVEQERDNRSRGSNNGDTTGRKRRQQHRLRVVRPRTHSKEVIPEKGNCHGAVQARDTLAFKQPMLNVNVNNVAPSVFPSLLCPRSRIKIRTRGEDVIVAETTRCGTCPRRGSKVSYMITLSGSLCTHEYLLILNHPNLCFATSAMPS